MNVKPKMTKQWFNGWATLRAAETLSAQESYGSVTLNEECAGHTD